jgi:hypothetical protein
MLLFLSLAGCHKLAPNYLDGSLSESYDLTFDETEARLYSSELSVEYVEDPEGESKVALRVTLDVEGEGPKAGKKYDLFKYGEVNRSEAYNSPFPELSEGYIELDEYGSKEGADVQGTFTASFETEDGSTLQVEGGFKTELEVIDL